MKTKRILSLALASALLLLLPLLFAGCGKEKTETPEEEEHGEGWLTHVYRGTEVELPGNYSVFAADCDPETGTVRCVAHVMPAEGSDDPVTFALIEAAQDGTYSEIHFRLADGTLANQALFDDDGIYLIETGDTSSILRHYDRRMRATDEGVDLKPLFRYSTGDYYYIQNFVKGADGNLFFYSFPEILVLSPSYGVLCSVRTDGVNGIAADAEGRVWAWGVRNGQSGITEVVPGGSALGAMVPLADTKQVLFAPGHDLYTVTDSGIVGYDYAEDGTLGAAEKETVSYINSDIDPTKTNVLSFVGTEEFLALERQSGGITRLIRYRRVEDIDLTRITTVRVALSANGFGADAIRIKAVEFNKSRSDIRIVLDDYTPAEGAWGDDLYANEDRLALGITTGTYRPDLVICMSNGPVIKVGAEQGFFSDLTPLTEREGLLNKDNILGCVKRTFTDQTGRLFALTNSFTLGSVLISTAPMLGDLAEKSSWTLEEFLDFAAGLPGDVVLMKDLTRESAPRTLLGAAGYAAFIDYENGVCSFDSGVFARYLDFLAALPTRAEYSAHSPYDLAQLDMTAAFPYYRDGKIALASSHMRYTDRIVSLEGVFGTKDWVLIGVPTDTGYAAPIAASAVFAVTADVDGGRIDAVYEALEALMTQDDSEIRYAAEGFLAFRSALETVIGDLESRAFYVRYGGGGLSSAPKSTNWEEWINRDPGIETEFTEEDAARLRDLLDNKIGIPYSPAVSEEVTAIVDEEVSAFLGGVGTAQDCASKIQSRVSIWLSEHR